MSKKKIVYLHGTGSSKNATKVQLLKKYLPEYDVVAFDIPMNPEDAINTVKQEVFKEYPDLIIGSSLGAFYANCVSGPNKLLLNPCFYPSETLKNVIGVGTHDYLNVRENGEKTYDITYKMLETFKDYEWLFYNIRLDLEDIATTYGVVGTSDTVCPKAGEQFKNLFGDRNLMTVEGMTHSISENDFVNVVVPLVRKIVEG